MSLEDILRSMNNTTSFGVGIMLGSILGIIVGAATYKLGDSFNKYRNNRNRIKIKYGKETGQKRDKVKYSPAQPSLQALYDEGWLSEEPTADNIPKLLEEARKRNLRY